MSHGEATKIPRGEDPANPEIAGSAFQRTVKTEKDAQTRSPKNKTAARVKNAPGASAKQPTIKPQVKPPHNEGNGAFKKPKPADDEAKKAAKRLASVRYREKKKLAKKGQQARVPAPSAEQSNGECVEQREQVKAPWLTEEELDVIRSNESIWVAQTNDLVTRDAEGGEWKWMSQGRWRQWSRVEET
ncbi:hypothetical protein K470DRAFT_291575 [Piedraia hortae CBS 480.64]|uniref:Uncharacterized protein n=1 Tax=Piedraia hortae CBS 480.64 TaxID=1314780 RepID=A0A6A7C7I9_9PEZI|nr:hypothetical protein K470DRAFT_291575 [Piedraia hortae CBS 480.64]